MGNERVLLAFRELLPVFVLDSCSRSKVWSFKWPRFSLSSGLKQRLMESNDRLAISCISKLPNRSFSIRSAPSKRIAWKYPMLDTSPNRTYTLSHICHPTVVSKIVLKVL